MTYDSIIIGAGIAGSVIARELAEKADKQVLLIEERQHIGGNCYDEKDEHGILVHQYGPHIFHTNIDRVYEYLSHFTDWYHFKHEVVANVYGKLIPVPFNLNTLYMVYKEEKARALEEKLVGIYGLESRVPILKLCESEDEDIRGIAEYVYENIFLHYTMKQWGQKPEEIDSAVTGRVPILISRDNGYFQDKHQGIPLNGYTYMFEKILDHPNINVRLGVDARDLIKMNGNITFEGKEFTGEVIYTGSIDELFDCEYGRLPYRSLEFDFSYKEESPFQSKGVVNYTVTEEYTRITEFKYLTGQTDVSGTSIVKEYPFAYTGAKGQIPYYAIQNEENGNLYKKYLEKTRHFSNFFLLGRLAEYKYYNIDIIVSAAMDLAEKIICSSKQIEEVKI